eukprot:CAMPEP_0117554824 /NCGR_PEP_ID=MMETSP0784-20121206/50954_1 /TAXON_ID=39447 /ORGANISM="" /LENGTH=477 /DNA_ID=CAMNT_0005352003 /DNA_START=69 /DNA_END=1498 /DNA_ORIENTATION=-
MLRLALLINCLALGFSAVNDADVDGQHSLITSRHELNAAIESGPNRNMGFLSEANYRSVHTVLSSKVVPKIFTTTSELYDAVERGEVVAGLISGQPDASRFSVFSTDLVSPRSFQMKPGPDSEDEKNPPFQAVEVHTCRADDLRKVPFPDAAAATGLLRDVLQTKRLRILAYGADDDKPDWHADGNYQVDPPVGFWPDYMNFWMAHFQEAYGSDIVLERVWMKAGGTEMVLNGSIHMTEPYYIYENLWDDRVKKWSHEFSCVVMGYEQQFFAKAPTVSAPSDADATEDPCSVELQACQKRRLLRRVETREQLNAAIDQGPNTHMGFLSEANYLSVHTVLSSNVSPMFFTDTSELYNAVDNGDVVAALISGQPDGSRFSVFSTDLVSPRSFQMKPGPDAEDLMKAVDAAVVRTHNAAELLKAQERNPPFQAVEVHTCRADDTSKIPFPDRDSATGLLRDVLQTKRLRILAYGADDDKP